MGARWAGGRGALRETVARADRPQSGDVREATAPKVLFLMPYATAGQQGPVAVWITAVGWATAAARRSGDALMLSPEGVMTPEEAIDRATSPSLAARERTRWRRLVPAALATGVKDVRRWRRARRFRRTIRGGPWEPADVRFVWQCHDLFNRAGIDLARALDRPLVLFVDAPLVWEARKWGVRRPGWGRLLEMIGEDPLLRAADLVACVSEEVADEVRRRGVPEGRILVTPCGVDIERFSPAVSGEAIRRRHDLGGRFVVGWVGSFRRFHGLDIALTAASALQDEAPDLTFLLVGDGEDRPRIERRARDLGLRNVLVTGTVPHAEIPQHIAAMDVALVLDRGDRDFHYSPLKLREYMASGKTIVAPDVGQVARALRHGSAGLLVEPGDPETLASAIRRAHDDPQLRRRLGSAAREEAVDGSSWDLQLQRVEHVLFGDPAA